ncbi:hypothetical protein [Streptomyces sp. 3213.3]|uniref:hypothetical protein n=1 Tax=Streptomyces sp. 3213.3 TaxID=1855348 RepID=UPI001041E490|nr:hypothetical protein [Streptomyces sp. 3213.3]
MAQRSRNTPFPTRSPWFETCHPRTASATTPDLTRHRTTDTRAALATATTGSDTDADVRAYATRAL